MANLRLTLVCLDLFYRIFKIHNEVAILRYPARFTAISDYHRYSSKPTNNRSTK